MFTFDKYSFDTDTYTATFSYIGADQIHFTEKIQFAKTALPINHELLERALFLSFILIGTSYYKSHPTTSVNLSHPIDSWQASFFSTVYQDGLSQFAFENQLTRSQLAHFSATSPTAPDTACDIPDFSGVLSLQSGGKDSLLTATMLQNSSLSHSFWYLSSSNHHPVILEQLHAPFQTAVRTLDLSNLRLSGGLNGHVPITYIVQSLALVQAILNHQNTVLTSIGQEGNEPHAIIPATGGNGNGNVEPELPVNHQWSKTWPAEQLFAEYVKRYVSPDLHIGSPLRGFSELKIAELFAEQCWSTFGHAFSSCNVANYRQGSDNQELKWCGHCAKCANSYLLFAPFVPKTELDQLFGGSLFEYPDLIDIFKGLLGVDGHIKPFECIGEVAELRKAYQLKRPEYPALPFAVPESVFNYQAIHSVQGFIKNLF